MYTALRATSATLRGRLEERFHADVELRLLFDPARGGSHVITPSTPQEMQEANEIGLSVWLYRVVRDEQQLNAPARRAAFDREIPPPLPLRLHYLLAPIVDNSTGNGPDLEQAILGKALQTFHDAPIIEGADLRDDFAGTETSLRVRLESHGLEELTRVWDALESSYQLSVSYEVSLVLIASALPERQVAAVHALAPRLGVAEEVPG